MKKILFAAFAAILSCSLYAQDNSDITGKVQMAVYVPEDCETIPASVQPALKTKLSGILSRNGMAATPNYTQFFLTCTATVLEKNIIPGAPTKYQQKIEINLAVIDAASSTCFGSIDIPAHAVANSEQKAFISCFSQIPTSSTELKAFFKRASDHIIAYYDGKAEELIKQARVLAKGKKYAEALFMLSVVPEACNCYSKIVDAGVEIYSDMIDMESYEALAKAKAIWAAGQNPVAAAEAGAYIAQVNPNSKYYSEAVALSDEIKKAVKSDIDYYRKQDELERSREHDVRMGTIAAWKAVGVAYGNNQKSHTYHDVYAVR